MTITVGQSLYRISGEQGSEGRLRRGMGRVAYYLDVCCAIWLISCGTYCLLIDNEMQFSLVIGLIIVALAEMRWLRSRRARQSPILTGSLTVISNLLEVAWQEAYAYKQESVGLHHVLLAIARLPDRPSAVLLTARGATESRLRVALAPHLEPDPHVSGNRPLFNAAVTRAVTRAMSKVQANGDVFAKPEQLLRALLRESDSIVPTVLIGLGIDTQQLNESLLVEIRRIRRIRVK